MIHLKMFRKCILFPASKHGDFGGDCDVHFIWCRKPETREKAPNSCEEASKHSAKILQLCKLLVAPPKASSVISAKLNEGWILPGSASLHWLQEESGWDSTPDFQSCKYSWDESNPKRLSHKLYQNTRRFREGWENGGSLCILAHRSAHRWWITAGCARGSWSPNLCDS